MISELKLLALYVKYVYSVQLKIIKKIDILSL
jgi:hypothetical protein